MQSDLINELDEYSQRRKRKLENIPEAHSFCKIEDRPCETLHNYICKDIIQDDNESVSDSK